MNINQVAQDCLLIIANDLVAIDLLRVTEPGGNPSFESCPMFNTNTAIVPQEIESPRSFAAERHEHRPDRPTFSEYLDQDATRFFYRWGGELSSILIRVRARFEGDLDQYLLYMIFLLAELAQGVAAAEAQARGDAPKPRERKGMNALSLSDITLIPRETARRKLQQLVADGYLTREGEGLYFLGDRYGLDAFFWDLKPLFWDSLAPPAQQRAPD